MKLVIVSGMSGAGKTKAINALEDIGYYCIDNIPPKIMLVFTSLFQDPKKEELQKVAMVVDSRSKEMFSDLDDALEELKQSNFPYQIIFLDASTEVLIKRFKESRRRHPLMDDDANLEQAINTERKQLQPLREMANFTIDTSQTHPSQLRERVIDMIEGQQKSQPMSISCMSFGFRYGNLPEADLVFDVRCLPNPYYIPELREHSGDEAPVRDYVMQWPQTQELLAKLEDLLAFLVPLYIKEGKSQLVIAVGCTGGMHRSVAMAIRLCEFLRGEGYKASVSHRDKQKNYSLYNQLT